MARDADRRSAGDGERAGATLDHPGTRIGLVLLAWGWVVAVLAPLVALGDRLPSPLAIHWAADGTPNGAGSTAELLTLALMLTVVPAIVATVSAATAHRATFVPTTLLTTFVGALGAVVTWLTVAANLDARSWDDAAEMGPVTVLAAVVLAVAAAAVAGIVAARVAPVEPHPSTPFEAGTPLPPEELPPGTPLRWVGHLTARWPWAMVVAVSAGALVVLPPAPVGVALVILVTLVVAVEFCSVTVTVDERGLRASLGPMRWPTVGFDLDEITAAQAIDLRPMAWGGWGYRGSVRIAKRAAVVLRAGPGIELALTGDRRFAVTVDDAPRGAAVLEALLQRRS